jgi:hypothetical protein
MYLTTRIGADDYDAMLVASTEVDTMGTVAWIPGPVLKLTDGEDNTVG